MFIIQIYLDYHEWNNEIKFAVWRIINSRWLLIQGGRETGDRDIAEFILNGSGGTIGSNIVNFLQAYEVSGSTAFDVTINQDGENIYIPENFYTHGFVQKLLEHDIITKDDIIEQYISKTGLSSTLLVELTEFIFKVFDEKQAKLISNLQTGLFGKIYNKRQEAQLSTSWDMTQSMIEEGYFPKTLKDGLYMMTKTNKTRMKSDTRPIWIPLWNQAYGICMKRWFDIQMKTVLFTVSKLTVSMVRIL